MNPNNQITTAFRVHYGDRIGVGTADTNKLLHEGDEIKCLYATTNIKAVDEIIYHNDWWAEVKRGDPFDRYQQVLIIDVKKYHIPEPDHTHNPATDTGQIVIDEGKVSESISVDEFRHRFKKELESGSGAENSIEKG